MKDLGQIGELLRMLFFDVLGLLLPGGAVLIVLEAFGVTHQASPMRWPIGPSPTIRTLGFLAVSYVLGYAVQGTVNAIWPPRQAIGRLMPRFRKRGADQAESHLADRSRAISPADVQAASSVESTALYDAAKAQLARYCELDPEELSHSDVVNLAFSLSRDEFDTAYQFTYRADLCAGMFVVCGLGVCLGLAETLGAWMHSAWAVSAYVPPASDRMRYTIAAVVLACAFYSRAGFYYALRGRVPLAIALALLAKRRDEVAAGVPKPGDS